MGYEFPIGTCQVLGNDAGESVKWVCSATNEITETVYSGDQCSGEVQQTSNYKNGGGHVIDCEKGCNNVSAASQQRFIMEIYLVLTFFLLVTI